MAKIKNYTINLLRKYKMLRRTNSRIIGGVCGALSKETGIDVSIIRIAFAVTSWFFWVPAIIYIVAWIIIPEE